MGEMRELLTTNEVADLLRVHPKHVYRLLRRGLPGRRIGGEWRFSSADVLRWSGAVTAEPGAGVEEVARDIAGPAPLLAANGDLVIEVLMRALAGGPTIGFVPADQGVGLEMLASGEVLAAGSHGAPTPSASGERLVFIHLVDREIGLAGPRGSKPPDARSLAEKRLASRPRTAGARVAFDAALADAGVDTDSVHASASLLESHQEVVCAVARGDADVGLASAAWAQHLGLSFRPLFSEPYGLTLRAASMGDPRVVRVCETAQGRLFRRRLAGVAGYGTRKTGNIAYSSG